MVEMSRGDGVIAADEVMPVGVKGTDGKSVGIFENPCGMQWRGEWEKEALMMTAIGVLQWMTKKRYMTRHFRVCCEQGIERLNNMNIKRRSV